MAEPGKPIYHPERSTGLPLAMTLLLLAGIVLVFLVIFVVSR